MVFELLEAQIGKGMDPAFPGADPDELVGWEHDVLHERRSDPNNSRKKWWISIGKKISHAKIQKFSKTDTNSLLGGN